jgi:hypothetical protein
VSVEFAAIEQDIDDVNIKRALNNDDHHLWWLYYMLLAFRDLLSLS